MYPRPTSFRSGAFGLVFATILASPAILQAQQDAPPVNAAQLLEALRAVRQQQVTQQKTQKTTAYQQIAQAAGSGERATALWEAAVKATQMDGAGKENSQLKAWKDSEGEAFKEREVQNAVRLHVQWLALTLQHSSGVTVKEMLSPIIAYTKDLLADEIGMENMQAEIKKEKEAGTANPKRAQRGRDDAATKKAHDQVLNRSLNNSVIVQWLKLNDLIKVPEWELNPGNLDGIYKNIILPELRAEKDQRVFEYWDMKFKREADTATQSKLAFEIEKFNTLRGPALLWNRAQEFVFLGMKNRGVNEMFGLIKKYPTHPDADEWVDALEELLAPPKPSEAAPAGSTPPATPAPLPGQ